MVRSADLAGTFRGDANAPKPVTCASESKSGTAADARRPAECLLVALTARFESHEAGSRLRLGWARRWSMRRIAARVTIASETSGSVS
jgi:hypothetical protein